MEDIMLKQKNAKDWKTTVMGIVGALLVIAGLIWPEKVDPETQEIISTAVNEILIGVGALIPVIISIFGIGDNS
jgi:hypothetical protein